MADKTSVFGNMSIDSNRGASSLGNQEKFKEGDKFFKLDHLGYEGISEVISSRLAMHTSLAQYGITEYFPYCVTKGGKQRLGCGSKLFNLNRGREITLYKILTAYFNTDLKGVYKIYEETYDTLTLSFFDFVRELIYSLYQFDILPWMTQLLKFDWLILNEDRHFRNISFFIDDDRLLPVSLFDNGAALLSDLGTYPLSDSIEECISRVTAKPFNSSFRAQVQKVEAYGEPKLQFRENRFSLDVSDLKEYYSEHLILRALRVLQKQMQLLYPYVEVDYIWK